MPVTTYKLSAAPSSGEVANAEAPKPVPLWCRICEQSYWSDRSHRCNLDPVIRARESQKRRASVSFDGPDIKDVLEWLTLVCGRRLGVPAGVEEVRGRFHYETGYVWSWRKGPQSKSFSIFATGP